MNFSPGIVEGGEEVLPMEWGGGVDFDFGLRRLSQFGPRCLNFVKGDLLAFETGRGEVDPPFKDENRPKNIIKKKQNQVIRILSNRFSVKNSIIYVCNLSDFTLSPM